MGLNSLIGASVSRENKTPSSPSDIIGIYEKLYFSLMILSICLFKILGG